MSKATLEPPTQLRLPRELDERIGKIANANHLSKADVIRLCLVQTLPTVEANGITIQPAVAKAAHRKAA